MSKGSKRRPTLVTEAEHTSNWERTFGQKASQEDKVTGLDNMTGERHLVLSLDELRTIVIQTSAAFVRGGAHSQQEAEWSRTAALRDALEQLGFVRESEMIGGAA